MALATSTTAHTYYADGVGLDSAAGIAVSKPGGGTYNEVGKGKLDEHASYMDIDTASKRKDWPGNPESIDHLAFPPGEEIYTD